MNKKTDEPKTVWGEKNWTWTLTQSVNYFHLYATLPAHIVAHHVKNTRPDLIRHLHKPKTFSMSTVVKMDHIYSC